MKKRIISFIVLSFVVFNANAEYFFGDRNFEINISVPVGVSNNALHIESLLKKHVVIDLCELSSKVPNEGFTLTTNAFPKVGLNFKVNNVSVGINYGVEVNEFMNISKNLFTILGVGYQAGDICNIEFTNDLDIFYDMNVDVGISREKFKFHIKPTVFLPIASSSGGAGYGVFTNDEKGTVIIKTIFKPQVYSIFDLTDFSIKKANIDFKEIGFDIGGSLSYSLSPKSQIDIDARIPLFPGKISNLTEYEITADYQTTLQSITTSPFATTVRKSNYGNQKYYVNRPLKLSAYFYLQPFGKYVDIKAGGGFGIFHPFVQGTKFYPEYYIGTNFNLVNILKFGLSTEYTDRVFKNQLSVAFNLRIIEVEVGASMQSANFARSFSQTGLGAFVEVSFGY